MPTDPTPPQPSPDRLHPVTSVEFEAPWVRARGRIDRQDRVSFSPCLRTFRGPDARADVVARRSPLTLSGESGDGTVLASTGLQPGWVTEEQTSTTFSARLPYDVRTRRIVVSRGQDRLGVLEVSAELPVFRILHPLRAQDIDPDAILRLQWETERGAEAAPVTYFVRYTPDGQHFHRVGFGLTEPGFALDLPAMPGGERCFAQVLATNGYQTAAANTPTFAVPAKPARVLLSSPDGPYLFAQGFDPQSGPILGDAITWTADGAPVASGGGFDARSLTIGEHLIAVSVTPPDGRTVSQELGRYDGRTGLRLT